MNAPASESSLILLKLTGALLTDTKSELSTQHVISLARQIKKLETVCQFGIVIGGGNLFRGNQQGVNLSLILDIAHRVGMLATMMNGLILQDIFYQEGIATTVLSALDCPSVGQPPTTATIIDAFHHHAVIIFVGGTGAPFVTTDTAAVIRALQMGASEIWKATSVEGVYSADPHTHKNATLIPRISYREALDKNLGIMDPTALRLAQDHQINTRVFHIFEKDALVKAYKDKKFGSLIHS